MTTHLKSIIAACATLTLLSACDVSESMRDKSGQDPRVMNAREIAASNGCMGCHTVTNSVAGPAWRLVAERYRDTPNAKALLVDSINNGSSGRWREVSRMASMPGYQGKISESDLDALVDYILSLGNNAEN